MPDLTERELLMDLLHRGTDAEWSLAYNYLATVENESDRLRGERELLLAYLALYSDGGHPSEFMALRFALGLNVSEFVDATDAALAKWRAIRPADSKEP